MIQFNLLPDVKLDFIRARRLERLVMLVSVVAASAALGVFIMLLVVVKVIQSRHIDNLTDDIKSKTTTLKNTKDLDKILTVQSQLKSLPELHNKKPATSRLFDYLPKLTPTEVGIAKMNLNFEDTTIVFNGTAPRLEEVNRFVDTLKFTTFTVTDLKGKKIGEEKKAFSNVVLKTFGLDDKTASYEINATFEQQIFDNSVQVTLNVPNVVTRISASQAAPTGDEINAQQQNL